MSKDRGPKIVTISYPSFVKWFFGCALGCYFLVLPVDRAWSDFRCDSKIIYEKTPILFSTYQNSIFQVYIKKIPNLTRCEEDGYCPVGTATLIHPDGYLITAKHIFFNHTWKYNGNTAKIRRFKKDDNGTLVILQEFDVVILKDDSFEKLEEVDIVLLQASSPTFPKSIPVVDPLLEPMDSLQIVATMGYPSHRKEPKYSKWEPIYQIDKNKFETDNIAMPGESGSVALNKMGQAVGILKGIAKRKTSVAKKNNYYFIHSINEKISSLQTPIFSKMKEEIIKGDLSPDSISLLENQKINSIDLIQFIKFLSQSNEIDTDRKINIGHKYKKHIQKSFVCKDMSENYINFVRLFPDIFKLHEIVDAARLGLKKYEAFALQQRIQIQNFPEYSNLGQKTISLFELSEKRLKQNAPNKFSNKYVGNFYFDWSAHLNRVKSSEPEKNISLDKIITIAQKAETLNNDWKTNHFLANLNAEKEQFDSAFRYATVAAKSNPPSNMVPVIEQDWKNFIFKASAKLDENDPQKSNYANLLENGIWGAGAGQDRPKFIYAPVPRNFIAGGGDPVEPPPDQYLKFSPGNMEDFPKGKIAKNNDDILKNRVPAFGRNSGLPKS